MPKNNDAEIVSSQECKEIKEVKDKNVAKKVDGVNVASKDVLDDLKNVNYFVNVSRPKKIFKTIVTCLVLLFIVVGGITIFSFFMKKEPAPPTIDTTAVLSAIKDVSYLSTVETRYLGLATVTNPKDFEDVLYHVTYEAVLKAGIDFSKVEVNVDLIQHVLYVYLPNTVMTDFDVDITSMDYLFIDSKAETNTVSAEAYQACVDDSKIESLKMVAIKEFAQDNARNLIEALTIPFLEVMDEPYTLEILPLEG
ncbi:MAG: DUF4230 domain-containing protein [Eubacteriales bacterium]